MKNSSLKKVDRKVPRIVKGKINTGFVQPLLRIHLCNASMVIEPIIIKPPIITNGSICSPKTKIPKIAAQTSCKNAKG